MFQKASKVKRFFKVSVWGGKKSGKTELALSFPKPCMADSEKGSLLFSDKFDFDVEDVNHWGEAGGVLSWLEKHPGKYETLIIDSLTVLYQDLIQIQTDYVRNRRGNEVLVQGDWGTIKRRWKDFVNRLIDLPMNIVLTCRSKEEYESLTDANGKDVSKKTGNEIPEIERSTHYIVDFIVHLEVIEDKKKKTAKYVATIDGSRRRELPKFKTFDVTNKSAYDIIFKPIAKKLLSGKLPERKPKPEPEAQEAIETAPKPNGMMMMVEALEKFAAPKDGPMATTEDIKVLMTRANEMVWPNGDPFKSTDGKTIIKNLFKVESSKELRKYQVDFLYAQFGKVLTDPPTARLALDEKGIPFVEPVSKDMSF